MDLAPWVYAASEEEESSEESEDEELFRRVGAPGAAEQAAKKKSVGAFKSAARRRRAADWDASDDDDDAAFRLKALPAIEQLEDADAYFAETKLRFVTGALGDAAYDGEFGDARANDALDDTPLAGDFEELDGSDEEGGGASSDARAEYSSDEEDPLASERARNAVLKAASRAKMDEEALEEEVAADEKDGDVAADSVAALAREKFAQRKQRSATEFANAKERYRLEGFRNGLYARVRLEGVPAEFAKHRHATRPTLLCGLLSHEAAPESLVVGRVRRHRWHAKVLKARDPVVFSCGWRRFQSAPLYSLEDADSTRHRNLKYTPEHMHCGATFYAPAVAPNSPIIGFHTLDSDARDFRVSLVGVVLATTAACAIKKKLKLTGSPYKVEKNTAFIDGMFNSALEAARFEGAAIKTVSGIRGAIKKALREQTSSRDLAGGKHGKHEKAPKPGAFRATFEDKVLLSDIVVCRLWVPLEVPKFCAPVLSHLAKATYLLKEEAEQAYEELEDEYDDDGALIVQPLPTPISADALLPMRTVAQLRRERRVPIPVNKDSVYGLRARGVTTRVSIRNSSDLNVGRVVVVLDEDDLESFAFRSVAFQNTRS